MFPKILHGIIHFLWQLLPTSPHFDLACGRTEAARKTLEDLARSNGKSLPPGELLAVDLKQRGQLKDLLTPAFRRTSALLALLWSVQAFAHYPYATTKLVMCRLLVWNVGNLKCQSSQTNDLPNLYLSLPSLALSISRIGQELVSSVS